MIAKAWLGKSIPDDFFEIEPKSKVTEQMLDSNYLQFTENDEKVFLNVQGLIFSARYTENGPEPLRIVRYSH